MSKGAAVDFPVRKNIAIPPARRPPPKMPRKYPFEKMDVGDMFFVPNKTRNTLSTHASTVGKELGMKFSTRLTYMAKDKQGRWELCREDTPGAVLGIGVWRES